MRSIKFESVDDYRGGDCYPSKVTKQITDCEDATWNVLASEFKTFLQSIGYVFKYTANFALLDEDEFVTTDESLDSYAADIKKDIITDILLELETVTTMEQLNIAKAKIYKEMK